MNYNPLDFAPCSRIVILNELIPDDEVFSEGNKLYVGKKRYYQLCFIGGITSAALDCAFSQAKRTVKNFINSL